MATIQYDIVQICVDFMVIKMGCKLKCDIISMGIILRILKYKY